MSCEEEGRAVLDEIDIIYVLYNIHLIYMGYI